MHVLLYFLLLPKLDHNLLFLIDFFAIEFNSFASKRIAPDGQ